MEVIYGVLSLKEKLGIEVLGFKTTINLNWYDNQIGAMPVFKDYTSALKYVNGDKDRVFKLELKND